MLEILATSAFWIVVIIMLYIIGKGTKKDVPDSLPPDSRPSVEYMGKAGVKIDAISKMKSSKALIISNQVLVSAAIYEVFKDQFKDRPIMKDEIDQLLRILEI